MLALERGMFYSWMQDTRRTPRTAMPRRTASSADNDNHSIWLADFANKTPNSSSIYLHGFDVSSDQFPPGNEITGPETRKIPLSVQDALNPYPPEHQGRYDLVHIRLLTAGLKQADYGTVLKNARTLLSKSDRPPPTPETHGSYS